MSCLYVVRCNFSDPAQCDAWQRWYSGEKQDWLLSRPGFLAGQRFAAVRSTDGVEFLALYALESPDALKTPEYNSGWGWGAWRPYIIDWSRNLFDGVEPETFLTKEDELLRAVFVTSSEAVDTNPDLQWTRVQPGLDGSLVALGLGRTTGEPTATEGTEEGLFRPASRARYSS
ncbi:conserved hypothetical protein [Frankia sp. Hr75.2]|nr:conserved hypothetical protein [Frankia sp. Hr75.2]